MKTLTTNIPTKYETKEQIINRLIKTGHISEVEAFILKTDTPPQSIEGVTPNGKILLREIN